MASVSAQLAKRPRLFRLIGSHSELGLVVEASGEGADVPLRGAALALLVALAAAVTAQGAFYQSDQRLIAAPLLVAVAATLIRARSLVVPWWMLVTGGALAAWALHLGEPIERGAGIAAMVAGVIGVVLVVASTSHPERVALTGAVVVLVVAVALSGWWGVAIHSTQLALPGQGLWRASTTLTYANAAAGLIGPVGLFALARSTVMRGLDRDRWMVGTLLLVVGLLATLSRAGFIAFACGLIVVVVRIGMVDVIKSLIPVLLGSLVALGALGPSLTEEGNPQPAIALMGLLGAIVVVVVLSRQSPRHLGAIASLASLVTVVVLAVGGGGNVFSRISEARLSMTSTDRSEMFSAGIDSMREDWWTGVGPGKGRLHYYQKNGHFVEARFVHNEYLQVGVELGVIGMILLVGLLASIAVGVRKGSRSLAPNLSSGTTAALVALGIQGGFDFLWHIPAIPLVGAVFVGLAWSNRPLFAQSSLDLPPLEALESRKQ